MRGLLELAKQQIKLRQFEPALSTLQQILDLDPAVSKSAYALMARVYRELGEQEKEQQTLESLVKLDADSVEPLSRLLEMTAAASQWEKTKKYARRLIALNPLIQLPHRYLSIAAEKTEDSRAMVESLSVLARMNPLDRADVHFRLASAQFRQQDFPAAKRNVLMALEQAPRYREAHQLLLRIAKQESGESRDEIPVSATEVPENGKADDTKASK